MKYYLSIDRGNTSVKAALYHGDRLVDIATDSDPKTAVRAIIEKYNKPIAAVIYSTVGAGGETAMSFLQSYAPMVMSVKGDIRFPIKIKPEHFATLGGDRIAAAAGAYALFAGQPILVVDSGTAVTYDLVTREGVFEGGNIAPGIRMSLDAMHRYTALLPALEVPHRVDGDLLGQDTESAMINGAVYSVVGSIESLCRRLGEDTQVVLTGGTSPLIAPLLQVPVHIAPHLVTDGLMCILKTNSAALQR